MKRCPSGSNFESLQNDGVNESQSEVVEPRDAAAPEHEQFTGHKGVQSREGPDTNCIGEVNGEVAADEKTDQDDQQRSTTAPPGTRPMSTDRSPPTALKARQTRALE